MYKYIRCMKDTGQAVGGSFEEEPVGLPHTIVFWVRVPANTDGSYTFPAPPSADEQVSFVLTKPLTADELVAKNLVKELNQGFWQYTPSQSQGNELDDAERLKQIDLETFKLIKQWCSEQPEGCEEAFLVLGIADQANVRYQAYLEQKATIKAGQNVKKAAVTE